MTPLVTGTEMRRLDKQAIDVGKIPAAILMDHAGRAVAEAVLQHGPSAVCIVCGKGHNGGDGWVAARWLQHWSVAVEVVTLVAPDALTGDARMAADMALAGGVSWHLWDAAAGLPAADLYVDALLGTGVSRELTGTVRAVVEALNQTDRSVVSVDVPSGIDADTGAVLGVAVKAVETVAIACEKLGTAVTPGAIHAGRVRVVDIGIPVPAAPSAGEVGGMGEADVAGVADAAYVTADDVAAWLPDRTELSHKGTYGTVAIAAGEMRGAAILAALGAARAGAGVVRLGVRDVAEWTAGVPPEFVVRARAADHVGDWHAGADVLVLGPGLGQSGAGWGWQHDIAHHNGPGVLDADALTWLLADPAASITLPPQRYVLTPHPKECGVLLGTSTENVQANRVAAALAAARRYHAVVLLKGHRTVIASPSGIIRVNRSGDASLATAGTGDVLAGIIGALLAQGLDPMRAACAGAYLHGRAGEQAGSIYGMASVLASDVVEHISRAIISLSTNSRS